ncbi:MAG: tetratricopeptide repeat protein [Candidatus Acidiferrales bacterium]
MYRSQVLKIQKWLKAKSLSIIYGLSIGILLPLFATAVSAQFGGSVGGSSIRVSIYSGDGDLLSVPAHVTVSPQGSLAAIQQTVCDNGFATFTALPSGNYVVTVQAPGFEEGSAEATVLEAGEVDAMITVEQTKDPSTDVGAKGIVLAPKANKELNQGLDAIRSANFDQAQRHLETAYRLAPGNPDVNSAMGELYLAQKNLPEAEHYIDRATSLGPDNIEALLGSGELRILQQNAAAAESPLERAVDLAPRNKFAHWLLGVTYFDLGLYEKCRTEALAVININKGTATDGAFLLGESLAALGRTAQALDILKKFIRQVPRDPYTTDAKKLIDKLQTPATGGAHPRAMTDAVASK